MNVKNVSVYMGDDPHVQRHAFQKGADGEGGKSIRAGSLKGALDPIEQKKQLAQKKALKVVGDVFANDKKLDEGLDADRQKVKALKDEVGAAKKQMSEIEQRREALREEHGVAPDSEEERQLKLLEKEVDASRSGSGARLSKEERQELAQIHANGLTDYQKQSIEMKQQESAFAAEVTQKENEIVAKNAAIREAGIERLKHHAMVDAGKESDAIMEAASGEIVGMLVGEAKDHIEEDFEKQIDAAKEKAEEKKELKERIEKAKEEKKEQAEVTEDILEAAAEKVSSTSDMENAQHQIKELMHKMNLISEDLKGAKVDENI